MQMTPQYIFCKCMKPWILCVNKKASFQIDVRDLLNTYNMSPYFRVGKDSFLSNPNYSLKYDFINGKLLNSEFKCRFLDTTQKNSDCKSNKECDKKCH